MTHNTTVPTEVYKELQGHQRHVIIKHDPLFMPGDTLMVSEPDSRQQLKFEIVSCSKENINQKGDLSLLGLYAQYNADDITTGPLAKGVDTEGSKGGGC